MSIDRQSPLKSGCAWLVERECCPPPLLIPLRLLVPLVRSWDWRIGPAGVDTLGLEGAVGGRGAALSGVAGAGLMGVGGCLGGLGGPD
jgi:hypothetical protein